MNERTFHRLNAACLAAATVILVMAMAGAVDPLGSALSASGVLAAGIVYSQVALRLLPGRSSSRTDSRR